MSPTLLQSKLERAITLKHNKYVVIILRDAQRAIRREKSVKDDHYVVTFADKFTDAELPHYKRTSNKLKGGNSVARTTRSVLVASEINLSDNPKNRSFKNTQPLDTST